MDWTRGKNNDRHGRAVKMQTREGQQLQEIADLLNKEQRAIVFTVRSDRLIYIVDGVVYVCSLDDVAQMVNDVYKERKSG